MSSTCPIQETCNHYNIGDKRRTHHRRLTEVCQQYLAMDCPKMMLLVELELWAFGKETACNLEKIRAAREAVKGMTISESN